MDDLSGVLSPQLQGILSGAFAGMQAAGPSRMPTSLGQVIGAAGQAGLGGYNSSLNTQRQFAQTQSLIDLQKQEAGMKAQQLKQLQDQYAVATRILRAKMPGIFGDVGALSTPTDNAASGAPTAGALSGAMGGIGPIPNQTVGAPNGVAPIPSGAGSPNIQPAASEGGLSSLDPDTALAMQMFGGPMGDVGKSIIDLNKVTALRPGAPGINALGKVIAPPTPIMAPGMQFDMNTRTASPVPGYAQGAAGIAGQVTGSEAAAKAPYEFQNVMVNGKEVPVSSAQLATGQGMTPTVNGKPVPPSEAAAANAALNAGGKGQQVSIPGNDPWASIPKVFQPSGVGQTDYQKGIQGASADQAKTLSEKFGTQADQANTRLALNQQALSLVDQADTGPYAARIADVKNLLVSRFGLPESDFENTPSATVALQKDLVNAATQKAKSQFGSRITQSEVQLMLQKASPNVDMPKAAIRYLINTDNATSQYQIQQAQDFGKYVSGGGDPMQFEGWYAKNFPMTKAVGDVHITTPPKNYTDADIKHTAMKYNISPDEVKKRLGLQ